MPVSNLAPGSSPRPGFAVLSVDRVVVLIWRERVSLEGVSELRRQLVAARRRFPQSRLGFLTVIEPDTELSTPASVRRELSQLLAEMSPDIGAAAIAYEGRGFKAVIVRSVITAVNMAGSVRFPSRVFDQVRLAVDWIASESGSSFAKLTGQLDQARRRG